MAAFGLAAVVYVFLMLTNVSFISIKNVINTFPKSICFDSDKVVLQVLLNRYIEVKYSDIREVKQVDFCENHDWIVETNITDKWNRYDDYIYYTFKNDTGKILKMLLSDKISRSDISRYHCRKEKVPTSRLSRKKIDSEIEDLNDDIKLYKYVKYALGFLWVFIISIMIYARALTCPSVFLILVLFFFTLLQKWIKNVNEEKRVYLERKKDQ